MTPRSPRIGLCLAIMFFLTPSLALARLAEPAPRLKALFLGDQGHHRPSDRAAQLIPVMQSRGIDITYTENLDDLNPEKLARYDALILYANIDVLPKAQETALLDYVNNGGGFVPLHCASFCFRNSPEFVALVGAQFKRHGTGEFETKTVDAKHPITNGLEPFKTWDETYVHTLHNEKDRHVLQTRQEGDGEEPWTWVRTHGKGRIFYTAYGHDGRTWGNPGFNDLVERGIRWASAKGEVFDSRLRPSKDLKKAEYEPAADKIPQYLPGQRWGTQGEAFTKMQKPMSPSDSVKHMVMPSGFEAKLFAAEPDVAKPICMAWDHKGRLWIAETFDYPNNLQPKGQGHDQIKICEDTDGDGKADKFTVFADHLSIPTSFVFSNGGVIVFQVPDTVFLKDSDGDGKADVKTTLFTGWGTNDTHAGPSNLHYGFDNWIYGIVGYSGFNGEVGGEQHRFGQGFYRFKPDGSKLEFLRSTNNNSWGLSFNEEGVLFGSTANGCPSVYMPIPNRYYESVRGWTSSVLNNIASSNKFYPVTEKVRQVDWFGGFTAAAGHAIYTARAYPESYWNKTAFVTEPTGHLTATFVLLKDGANYASENSWNLVASDDEWTSPIAAEVGPDGQVWMIDWYSYIVQHNPTPEGFKTGKGNAYVTPLRDKTHGRIYRIVSRENDQAKPISLEPSDAETLVKTLKNDNLLWRTHAQRLLVERGKTDVVPQLLAFVSDKSTDAIGLNVGAIHALWVLNGLNAIGDAQASAAALSALKHPSAGVRRNALLALDRSEKTAKAIRDGGLLADSDGQVRLAAFLTLAELPASPENAEALVKAIAAGRTDNDLWLADAATSAAAANAGDFLKALAAADLKAKAPANLLKVADRVAEHYGRGAPGDTVGSVIAALGKASAEVKDAVVIGLVRGWPKDRPATLNEANEKALVGLLPSLSTNAQGALVNLASRWGSKGLEKYTAEIAETLLATARNEAKPENERIAAARQLVDFRPADVSSAKALLELITPRTPPALASGLVSAVGRSDSPEVGVALVDTLPALTPSVRPEAVRALIARERWTGAFMSGVEAGKIQLAELSLDQKQALSAHPNKAIADRAKLLLSKGGGMPDADRQKVIDQIAPIALKGGSVANGKKVFTEQCAKCHRYNNEGGKIGPDLTGMAAHPKSELLIHILDPSRSVEGNYVQYSVATNEGKILNGLLSSETKTAIELLDTEGKKQQILREDIDVLAASKKSLMPEGFEKQVTPQAIADLLEYLTQRGKFMPLDLRKAATVVSTQGMFFDKESSIERLVFEDWSPKTFEGVPFLLVDPEQDRVPNVILLNGGYGPTAPKMPKAVSLPCNSPARAIHFLSGISGWGSNGDADTRKTTSMIVRLHFADGTTEDIPLRNGHEFADYIRRIDVPGSKFAFALRDQQVRYFSVQPKSKATIETIELVKGTDMTAPIVMAVTVETPE